MRWRLHLIATGLFFLGGCSASTSGFDATSADGGSLSADALPTDLGPDALPRDLGTADDTGTEPDTGTGLDTGAGDAPGFEDHSPPDTGWDGGPAGRALISAFAGAPSSNFVVEADLRTLARTLVLMPPPASGANCDAYGHRLVGDQGKLFALWWSNDRLGCPNVLSELEPQGLSAHAARATLPGTPLAAALVSASSIYVAATGTTSVVRVGYPGLGDEGEIAIGLTTTVAQAQYAPLAIRATPLRAYVAMAGRYGETRLPTVIVPIDPATHTPLDLDPVQAGLQGITLQYHGFTQMRLSPSGERLVVLSRGIDDGQFEHRADGGLEVIDLTTNQIILRVPASDFGGDGWDFDLLRDAAAIVGGAIPSNTARPALIEINLALGSATVFAASPGVLEYRLVRIAPDGSVWAARTEHDAVTTLNGQIVDVFGLSGAQMGSVGVGAESVSTSIEFVAPPP